VKILSALSLFVRHELHELTPIEKEQTITDGTDDTNTGGLWWQSLP